MFFGLGADGTVGANKASVKIIGEQHRPVRPGLLRLRLEEVGVGDRVAPALRARADPLDLPDRRRRLRRLPPVRAAREDAGARPAPSRAPRSCSTARTGADEVWDRLPAEVQEQIIDKEHRVLGDRRLPGRQGARDGQPHQHRDAAVLLPARRACCPPTRRSPTSRRRWRRPTATGAGPSSSATSPPSTRSLADARAGSTCPRRRRHQRTCDGAAVPDDAPDFVAAGDGPPHRRRGRPAARVGACPSTARSRPAPPSTRSGPSPRRSRSGTPTSASTAASAPSSARTPRSA